MVLVWSFLLEYDDGIFSFSYQRLYMFYDSYIPTPCY